MSFAFFTPDGTRAIYYGDLTTNDTVDLCQRIGVERRHANQPHQYSNWRCRLLALMTQDSSRVVIRGALTTIGVVELYSASPSISGSQIKLNNNPVLGGNVGAIALTADSSRVIYSGNLTSSGVNELYSASVAASGTQLKLNNTPVAGGNVSDPQLASSDSSRVAYRGNLLNSGIIEVFAASTSAAGTQIRLNSTPITGGNADAVRVTPDGSRVIYTGDLSTDGVRELYAASSSAAGTQIKLNNTPVAGGEIANDLSVTNAVMITPDSSHVIYRGDLSMDGVVELYSASTSANSTQVRLNDPLTTGEAVLTFSRISQDSSFVVFRVDTDADGAGNKIYSSPIVGGGASLLFSTPNDITSLQLAGNSIVFRADLNNSGTFELYSISVLPGDFDMDGRVDCEITSCGGRDLARRTVPMITATWRSHFGLVLGTGASLVGSTAVPEPDRAVLVFLAFAASCISRRFLFRRVATD